MNLLTKLVCALFPMALIRFLIKNKFVNKHQYPESTLIHRRKAKVLFEVEFNWYDKELKPISVIRAVKGGQIASVSDSEMYEFKEYEGQDRNAGSTL